MKKTINYFIIRAISAVVLGVLLILYPEMVSSFFVITIGILFIVPGLLALIGYFTADKAKRPEIPRLLAGIGSLLFGVVLVAVPGFFVNVLMYILGVFLIVGAIEQIVVLIRARKNATVSTVYYIIPLVVLATGVLVLFNPSQTAEIIFILIGAACFIYGIMEFIYWFKFKRKFADKVSTK